MSTSSINPNNSTEIVQNFFAAFAQRDLSAIDRYFAPDVVYTVIGTQSPETVTAIPWIGEYHKREGAKEFLAHLLRNIEIIGFGSQEFIEQGDMVAVFGTFMYRATSTGKRFDSNYAIKIKIRDGLIAEYFFHENTYAVAEAFRQSGTWEIENDGQRRTV
jgi:ketosteroid isomerase-like protein